MCRDGRMKLDRLIAKHQFQGRQVAHRLIAAGQVSVDGQRVKDSVYEVDRFQSVEQDGAVIRAAEPAYYFMLHKPAGYLSATSDPALPTVLDLIQHPDRDCLHIAGRLDRSTTGLLLLSNDGRWSKQITQSTAHVPKVYHVHTAEDIPHEAVSAFAAGFYFHTEGITTQPAELEILEPRQARVTLVEGRYHQVKRMFHRVGNRVVALHRERIGALQLPTDLQPGKWRPLNPAERQAVICKDANAPSSNPATPLYLRS
jgi:16S rRNA pseudouridine516 synthase